MNIRKKGPQKEAKTRQKSVSRFKAVSLELNILPSLRLIVWVGLGAVLWAAGAASRSFLVAALAYDGVLLLIALLDLILMARPQQVEVERDLPAKMNLGTSNTVTLRARQRTNHDLKLTLRDETPASWPVRVEGEQAPSVADAPVDTLQLPLLARLELLLAPNRETSAAYQVTPTRRGDFQFGAVSGRYASPLGLWLRQFRRDLRQTVRVYPDTSDVHRYELRLRQGKLREMGLHLMRLRGQGTDFESLRDYTRDDEYKNINWKASAKQGRLIATNYEIERDQTIMICLDCGRMMTAQAAQRKDEGGRMRDEMTTHIPHLTSHITPLSKLDCAINATVLLAHVAVSMGDSVGLLLFADGVSRFVAPRKGKTQVGQIIEALYGAQPEMVEPDYHAAYEYLLARKVRRSLVVTFTDLIDPLASRELLLASGALRKHHNALCVTINNSDVMELASSMPEASLDVYQKALAQRMLSQRDGALQELRKRGVGILDVPAQALTVETVNRYLDLKSRAAL